MAKVKVESCPKCGAAVKRDTRVEHVTYAEHFHRTLAVKGYWCTACPEVVYDAETIAEKERVTKLLKADVDKLVALAAEKAAKKAAAQAAAEAPQK